MARRSSRRALPPDGRCGRHAYQQAAQRRHADLAPSAAGFRHRKYLDSLEQAVNLPTIIRPRSLSARVSMTRVRHLSRNASMEAFPKMRRVPMYAYDGALVEYASEHLRWPNGLQSRRGNRLAARDNCNLAERPGPAPRFRHVRKNHSSQDVPDAVLLPVTSR